MRIVIPSSKYAKGRKRCERRGLNLNLLDEVVNILKSRNFTQDEIVQYNVHHLQGNMKQYMELHIGNKHSNWLLVYREENDKIILENVIITLIDTGTHDECLGSYDWNLDNIIL